MMTPRNKIKHFDASVKQRLLNLARKRDVDFNLILKRYAGERFLYRLSLSEEVDRFILKGATLFAVWSKEEFRATSDIDLLGSGSTGHEEIRQAIE